MAPAIVGVQLERYEVAFTIRNEPFGGIQW